VFFFFKGWKVFNFFTHAKFTKNEQVQDS